MSDPWGMREETWPQKDENKGAGKGKDRTCACMAAYPWTSPAGGASTGRPSAPRGGRRHRARARLAIAGRGPWPSRLRHLLALDGSAMPPTAVSIPHTPSR